MNNPAQQSREHVDKFFKTVQAIRESVSPLSEFSEGEVRDAVKVLMDDATAREREACAQIAESASEPAGAVAPGEEIESNPDVRKACLEIARRIRARDRQQRG